MGTRLLIDKFLSILYIGRQFAAKSAPPDSTELIRLGEWNFREKDYKLASGEVFVVCVNREAHSCCKKNWSSDLQLSMNHQLPARRPLHNVLPTPINIQNMPDERCFRVCVPIRKLRQQCYRFTGPICKSIKWSYAITAVLVLKWSLPLKAFVLIRFLYLTYRILFTWSVRFMSSRF